MLSFDPVALAARQLANDRQRTSRFPALLDRKIARMSASPLAFLRGAASLYYELLAAHPDVREGPAGAGWLVGDAHLENFGVYRPGALTADDSEVAFHLNDFDDAFQGPWRLDLLRLATSLLLAGRELGNDGIRRIELCRSLIDAYTAAAFGGAPLPPTPRPVKDLLDRASQRSRKQLLDDRTEVRKGKRRFIRGERYQDLPPRIEKAVPGAFAEYVKHLDASERPKAEQMEIVDSAQRIAGTGSLGCVRVAVLVQGKGGLDGAWVFDMKEQGMPSATLILPAPNLDPALRVVSAYRACIARPPRMLGTTRVLDLTMSVRRLAPQEDKLNLGQIRREDLEPLARYLGALLGVGHARGGTERLRKAWSIAERTALLDSAVAMAGIHEAVYLAYCRACASRSK